jgi:hypothetical protein
MSNEIRTMIEWPELRDFCISALNGTKQKIQNSRNQTTIDYYTYRLGSGGGCAVSFTGYSKAQAMDWAVNGYETSSLGDLSNALPIREKRKFIYAEEGDEIDLSAAWSGEDNFMGQWTKRQTIPGVAMEFMYSFQSTTDARVVNQYLTWLAKSVTALEEAGIDPEISVNLKGRAHWFNNRECNCLVRVKRQQEAVDLHSWSAMLSPAAFRTFGFVAVVLAGDSLGKYVDLGIKASSSANGNWDVKYDPETETIRTVTPYCPRDFPEETMNQKFRDAIQAIR